MQTLQNLPPECSRTRGPYAVRRGRPEDIPDVVVINRACLPENYRVEFFEDTMRVLPTAFLVAERAGSIVGYVMCRLENGISEFGWPIPERKGHLISLAVMPVHRDGGAGAALLQAALGALGSLKIRECVLEVRAENCAAVSLYEKFGFVRARTARNYYADGAAALVMAKGLEPGRTESRSASALSRGR